MPKNIMEDILFSSRNEAKPAGSSAPRVDTPGGRMKWYLLKEGKCPRCGYLLEADVDDRRLMTCENPHCNFGITDTRMKGILDDMLDKSQDENFNQGLLNNI